MATIKSFTDISQSKILAEILPIESADMIWVLANPDLPMIRATAYEDSEKSKYYKILPAWSLAALLDVLPNEIITDNMFECHYQIDIRKYGGGNNTTLYQIAYGNNSGLSGSWHDMINTEEKESLIDCCVAMIEKLHELKIL